MTSTTTQEERVLAQLRAAREAAPAVASAGTQHKNEVLLAAAAALIAHSQEILAANAEDIARGRESGMSEALIDRLALSEQRIRDIAVAVERVAAMTDPVGQVVRGHTMPNGALLRQVRVPLGVMGMVYEARPNVTVDAFALALKAGNAAVLRGSSSAKASNEVLVKILQDVLVAHKLPAALLQLLPCDNHDSVRTLITARGLVDMVIPRGSGRLISAVVEEATVPTIETGAGNCHLYIDRDADIQLAVKILVNGKTRRPSVCNATETVLIDRGLPTSSRYMIISELLRAGVTLHGDAEMAAFAPRVVPATDADWSDEYLSMDIAARFVDGVDGAIEHIKKWSTGHTEAIATENSHTARHFVDQVDAAAVMVNAPTSFTDGGEFGMGGEIGISTQKLHARGPFGLLELTTRKWIMEGQGQIRP